MEGVVSEISRPRPPRLTWPPLRPADRASSAVHSWAVPFSWAARPPLLAISRCFSGDIDANPRRSLRSVLTVFPPWRPSVAQLQRMSIKMGAKRDEEGMSTKTRAFWRDMPCRCESPSGSMQWITTVGLILSTDSFQPLDASKCHLTLVLSDFLCRAGSSRILHSSARRTGSRRRETAWDVHRTAIAHPQSCESPDLAGSRAFDARTSTCGGGLRTRASKGCRVLLESR